MEREKRRSVSEEAELDKRIAMIREKNEQIKQRQQEIDEDRANAEGNMVTQKKIEKTSAQSFSPLGKNSSKGGRGWDREWDHGKTPAETWRENVPSMENVSRLAGRGGKAHRGERVHKEPKEGNRGHRGKPQGPNTNGRLEGRIYFDKDESEIKRQPAHRESTSGSAHFANRDSAHKDSRRGGLGGRGGRHRRDNKESQDRQVNCDGKELKISIKNLPESKESKEEKKQENRGEQKQAHNRKDNKKKGERNNNDNTQVNKNRKPRRENDAHVVKAVVRIMLGKVVKNEKQEQRAIKDAVGSENANDDDKKSLIANFEKLQMNKETIDNEEIVCAQNTDSTPTMPAQTAEPNDVKIPATKTTPVVPKLETVLTLVPDAVITITEVSS